MKGVLLVCSHLLAEISSQVLFCIFFGGLECVVHSFAYFAHFVFLIYCMSGFEPMYEYLSFKGQGTGSVSRNDIVGLVERLLL